MSTYPGFNDLGDEMLALVKSREFWRTALWSIEEILKCELMTPVIVDPCAGDRRMGDAARRVGYDDIIESDIEPWVPGYPVHDFLHEKKEWRSTVHFAQMRDNTVFMNPPFSLAVDFVERCFELGARKVICFQRWAWYETTTRKDFWDKHPPNRIYLCGSRATCWMASIGPKERKGGTDKAHGWYVWERGQTGGPVIERIYND